MENLENLYYAPFSDQRRSLSKMEYGNKEKKNK